jgi:hypothetical protein
MHYTQPEIEVLSRELQSEYDSSTETSVEAIARAVKDLQEGDFCRRRLALDEEIFSAEEIMMAIELWSERIVHSE